MIMRVEDLIEEVEKQFPNDIMALEGLSYVERMEYEAAIKLIAFMKLLIEPKEK
jgi:hypothetical protein